MTRKTKHEAVALVVARNWSTRLPRKSLLNLGDGSTCLSVIFSRLRKVGIFQKIVLVTSTDPRDDELVMAADSLGLSIFRGETENVLKRMLESTKEFNSRFYFQIGGDCPFLDVEAVSEAFKMISNGDYDFVHNFGPSGFPDGGDIAFISENGIKLLQSGLERRLFCQHLYSFVFYRPDLFAIGLLKKTKDYSMLRFTVDYHEDIEMFSSIAEFVAPRKLADLTLEEMCDIAANNSAIRQVNSKWISAAAPSEPYFNTQGFILDLLEEVACSVERIKKHEVKPDLSASKVELDFVLHAVNFLDRRIKATHVQNS